METGAPRYRPAISALIMGGTYAVFGFATRFTAPLNIAIGAAVLASMGAFMTWRLSRGMPMLPTSGMVVLGVAALAVYAWWAANEPPKGIEWLEFAFVIAFPIAILFMAYRQWKRARSA